MTNEIPQAPPRAPTAPQADGARERLVRITQNTRWRAWLPPVFLFCAAWLVTWQYYPLSRSLSDDPGIFAYLSQLVADGLAPHKYAFNEQASLTFFVGGAAMRLGDLVGLHHLIAFRFISILCFAVVAVLTYTLALRLTRARLVGFVAGAIFIGFEGYGVRAATALEPKALMLVFGLTSLLALQNRKWIWAGVWAGLAGLAWQIAWGYLIVALLLAVVQGGDTLRKRLRAFTLTLAPALGILGIYFLYFFVQNAQTEMVQQTFLSPLLMHTTGSRSVLARGRQLAATFMVGYGAHAGFAILGITGFAIWLVRALRVWHVRELPRRILQLFFLNRRTAGTLLVICGFTLYSFLDFQNYPDWFPLLPYLAIFAAWLIAQAAARAMRFLKVPPNARYAAYTTLAGIVLVGSTAHAFVSPPVEKRMKGITWQAQERAALELGQQLGPDNSVWAIGSAELLFFMRRHNLNKYIYLFGNVDAAADQFEPGGFRQVLRDALAQKPALWVVARLQKRKFSSKTSFNELEQAVKTYVPLQRCKTLGNAGFYTNPEIADTVFPKNGQGCVKR